MVIICFRRKFPKLYPLLIINLLRIVVLDTPNNIHSQCSVQTTMTSPNVPLPPDQLIRIVLWLRLVRSKRHWICKVSRNSVGVATWFLSTRFFRGFKRRVQKGVQNTLEWSKCFINTPSKEFFLTWNYWKKETFRSVPLKVRSKFSSVSVK